MLKTTKTSIALWLGRASSSAVLQGALVVDYSPDGESLGSAFGRAFKVSYDDDFREAMRSPRAVKSLHTLLKGISYETEARTASYASTTSVRQRAFAPGGANAPA